MLKILQSSHCSGCSPSVLHLQWAPVCSSNLLSFFHHRPFAYVMIIVWKKKEIPLFPSPICHDYFLLIIWSQLKSCFFRQSSFSLCVPYVFWNGTFLSFISIRYFISLTKLRVPWDQVPGLFALFYTLQSDWCIIDVKLCVGSIDGEMDEWMNG